MKLASFDAIARALNDAGARYLVVGGLAVNAHGYLRFTRDVDLVVRLATPDIMATFQALESLGYRPRVPVTAEDFADPSKRELWRTEKGMVVLQLWSDRHGETPVDLFVYEPFDFDTEYARALVGTDPSDPPARFASIPALIKMKADAGRPTDLVDIEKLREIQRLQES